MSSPGLPLRLFQHCLWKGTEVLWGPFATLRCARRLPPCSRCHMASFQTYAGKPERDGDRERDMVRPGELFYIIPRHNRANPDVHTLKQGGECVFSRFRFSRDFPAYRFNGEGGKKKKLPLVSGSESWRFSAAPSNYNNELRRSNATPRHPEKQARDSSTEGPSPPQKKKLSGMVSVPSKFGGARICSAS